jgi:hypothetical protein
MIFLRNVQIPYLSSVFADPVNGLQIISSLVLGESSPDIMKK